MAGMVADEKAGQVMRLATPKASMLCMMANLPFP